MSIFYLPIRDNLFDGLYKKIIEYDNDIYDKEIEYFPRELLIECFLTALNDVLEKNEESIYFSHFQLSTSINSFYRTILLPSLEENINMKFYYENRNFKKEKSLFSLYSNDSFIDNIVVNEEIIKFYLSEEDKNPYIKQYGMYKISTEKTISPILFPYRDNITNELIF